MQEKLRIKVDDTAVAKSGVIVGVAELYESPSRARIVVGRPGLPNLESTLSAGGAVLFETPEGLLEVRVMSIDASFDLNVTVLVTLVSPRPGIAGGFVDREPDNSHFTTTELAEIATSLQKIRLAMRDRPDVSPEQLDFIVRKLAAMEEASERLGRKDWMNYAIGTLTSVVVTAAFTPEVSKALFQAASAALSWVFGGGVRLLPSP